MLVTREELQNRLKAASRLDPDKSGGSGEQYLDAVKALLPDAEALDDPELLLESRVAYANALRFKRWKDEYREVGAEALAVLRLGLLDWGAAPHRYHEVDVSNMWTEIHRVIDRFVRYYPEPADRVLRLLDELGRHCPPSRPWARYALDESRLRVAARRGDVLEAERLWLRLQAQGPAEDHLSPDIAAAIDATAWSRLGRDDHAIASLAPVLTGQIPRRDDDPYEDRLLMPYLRTGQVDRAVAVHQRAYERSGVTFDELAAHLEFCARTGNEERGLDVLHRNLERIAHTCESVEQMWAMAAVALLCRRAADRGLDWEWFEPCECECEDAEPDEECDWLPLNNYFDISSVMRWGAIEFARHMAELDGTPHLLEGVRSLLRAEPIVERLELPPDAGPPAHLAPPAPSVHLAATDAGGLRRELDRVRSMEPGDDRIVRTQHVLQNAVAAGRIEILAEARFVLLDDLLRNDDVEWDTDLFFTLRELFRLRDDRPDLLGADWLDAMWRAVPAVLGRVLTRPGPLVAVRGFLDRAERHRRPGTEDRHDVRWFRTEAAARSGDADAALTAWARFRELPPADRYTDRGAVLRGVGWWLDLGCDEQAFAAMAPLLADGTEEREDYLLLPYLRAGRAEKAQEVHERTYRTADDPTAVAAHLQYCARAGALEHGRDIIKRVSHLFHIGDDDDFPFDRLRLYAAAVRVSERLAAAGLDEPWSRSSGDGRPPEDGWTFARLAGSCRDDLRAYSWRWEEVTGTSFHTRAAFAIADDHQEGGLKMLVTREELRKRLDAAWKLAPDEPGGAKEPFMAAMAALLPDAEALGDPEMLFQVRLGYTFSLRSKGWPGGHSRDVFGEVLGVLRECLLMWHAEPHHHRGPDVTAMWSQINNVVDWYLQFDAEPADRVRRLIDELERYCPPERRWTRYMLDHARMRLAARHGDVAEVERLWLRLRAQGPGRSTSFPTASPAATRACGSGSDGRAAPSRRWPRSRTGSSPSGRRTCGRPAS